MPIRESEVEWVDEPPMNFWEATFLPAVFTGIKTTADHVTDGESVTQQYPEEKPDLPLHYRGVHRLNRDEQGRVRCVACMMCATACPARCIEIVGGEAPWPDRDKYPLSFVIDELKCIYCGMCEEACPVDAIELTHLYDMTGETRDQMMFDKEKLLSVFDQTKDSGRDPVRTRGGRLGPAATFEGLPTVAPATPVQLRDNASQITSPGVIR